MLFVSRAMLLKQQSLWKACLPTVKPFYAVKSNTNPILLKWASKAGLSVDCASPGEMKACIGAGFSSSDILYANTMKADHDLTEACNLGVKATTTDSVEGVHQLARLGKDMRVLIRLAVDDSTARCPFSIKFGAQASEWSPILRAIRKCGLMFGGVSFHVGSGASDPMAFRFALRMCRQFQTQMDCELPTVDIGGGFLPTESAFRQSAEVIQAEIDDWTRTSQPPREWIAEPGRFFSAPTQTLYCPIVFKKDGPLHTRYTLDDSLYGQFSSIVYDHAKPSFDVVYKNIRKLQTTNKKALFFGKTCDSLDMLLTQDYAPEYEVGDAFVFPYMGAYTSASATTFNGFPLPQVVYLDSETVCPKQSTLFTEPPPVPNVKYPIETVSRVSLSSSKLA